MAGSVGVYTQAWPTWVGHKSSVGTPTRANASTYLGMGYLLIPNAQNNEAVWPLYLDSVTWKVAHVHIDDPSYGIATFIFDGTTIGTIDYYAGAGAINQYDEITGYAQATPKAGDLTIRAATKNASSSGYALEMISIALIRTGGTPSTPGGTDTPGYTHELFPWMGTKSNTGWATRTQSSSELSGGRLDTDNTNQNNLITYDIWGETRTYKVALINDQNTDQGIYNITGINGTQTVDGYGALTSNVYTEVTGIAVTEGLKTVQVQMATKNGLSTAYGARLQSIKWISTGA